MKNYIIKNLLIYLVSLWQNQSSFLMALLNFLKQKMKFTSWHYSALKAISLAWVKLVHQKDDRNDMLN